MTKEAVAIKTHEQTSLSRIIGRISLRSALMLAASTGASFAHTDAVGFDISPATGGASCIAGTGSACYDVNIVYGSWHTDPLGANPDSTIAEGGLGMWFLSPTEAALYLADPVTNANIGTQIIGNSLNGVTDPLGTADSVGFNISNQFDPTVNYANTANLPSSFVPGVNYFFSATTDPTLPNDSGDMLIGTPGADYSSGQWTDPVTGITYYLDGQTYGHQVASVSGLGAGTYRFYYDALDTPASQTWNPTPAIQYISFTIDANGNITVPGAAGDTTPRTMSVLERVLGATKSGTNMNTLSGVFVNIAENLPAFDSTGAVINSIDGHITNTVSGIGLVSAGVSAGQVTAVNRVIVDIGNLSTTALGAVNTGAITVGANQQIVEAMASSSSAMSKSITQLGGSMESATLQLNVASNSTDIIGSVTNQLASINATVGSVSTTALGAVNTGTIISGVDMTVEGITSSIVGG